jgi:hypothetical protein
LILEKFFEKFFLDFLDFFYSHIVIFQTSYNIYFINIYFYNQSIQKLIEFFFFKQNTLLLNFFSENLNFNLDLYNNIKNKKGLNFNLNNLFLNYLQYFLLFSLKNLIFKNLSFLNINYKLNFIIFDLPFFKAEFLCRFLILKLKKRFSLNKVVNSLFNI